MGVCVWGWLAAGECGRGRLGHSGGRCNVRMGLTFLILDAFISGQIYVSHIVMIVCGSKAMRCTFS